MFNVRVPMSEQSYAFQADVSQVLSLVVNSLYSNKEIFLRELISNASDALDKLRFAAVTDPQLLDAETELKISLRADEEAGTLTIEDNGAGMSAEQLELQLGTIAHSGTKELMQKLQEAHEAGEGGDTLGLIGQFGVGFYSAFLVADRVEVTSRAAGSDEAHLWTSEAKDGFSIATAERETAGTSVVLHLKEAAKDYLQSWRLEELVHRYSDYVQHPIELLKVRPGDEPAEFERVNQASALWQRSESDITDEQYVEFYKHLARDTEDPQLWRHFKVEGTQMFTGLLFLPKRAPFDLFDPEVKRGIRLHVRRVFVMSDCEDVLPRWLRFMRGVLDSEDLPLNVSRELLQDSKAVRIMRGQVINHSLKMLEILADERPEDYLVFWEEMGAVLKEGLHFDPEFNERISKLLRYESTREDGKVVSLAEYVEAMKDDQSSIYYITGSNRQLLESSPHLESLKAAGHEVLLMTDAVDPFTLPSLQEFDGKPLVSAMSADQPAEGEEADEAKASQEARDTAFAPLIERFQSVLKEQVSAVRTSTRLTDSPACLVVPEGGLTPQLERMLRAQNMDLPETKRVLELNPDHQLIKSLSTLNDAGENSDKLEDWVSLIHDQALLAEGSALPDPAAFSRRMTQLMTQAVGSSGETS